MSRELRTLPRLLLPITMIAVLLDSPPCRGQQSRVDAAEPALPAGASLPVAGAPSWLPTFGGLPGTNAACSTFTVFDDGNGGGPALFAAGSFTFASNVAARHVAKWDGAHWTALGSGLVQGAESGRGEALAVFDDGNGPALYVGGDFDTAGGVPASNIAKWDGTQWSALGSGTSGEVGSLAVFDDGGGPALYAGGTFDMAGGAAASRIAKWDGSTWSALGAGVINSSGLTKVSALAVHDDGGGSALFAGGRFTDAGGSPASNIAKWDGANWSSLGSGAASDVSALASFNDGSGPALYAGGLFSSAGGVSASRIARWKAGAWSALGTGLTGGFTNECRALTVFDDGTGGGPALFVAGIFLSPGNSIGKWTGSSWVSTPGLGSSGIVVALGVFDSGSGPDLFGGGNFSGVSSYKPPYPGIARMHGGTWLPLTPGTNGAVNAVATVDAGSPGGPALYAGGAFDTIGTLTAARVARWNGTSWSPLGSGIAGDVEALAIFDDGLGGGDALYAGGTFITAGGVSARGIARWDGAAWSPVGGGLNAGTVDAFAVFDDGNGGGPALFVGGGFSKVNGLTVNNIAKWDGTSWSALGSGTNPFADVFALAVFDDGSGGGPALYAGGEFTTVSGVPANRIAKWNGTSWSALGSGVSSGTNIEVDSLAVFNDGRGGGPALYVGGSFQLAGGVLVWNVARWNGTTWSALGGGVSGSNENNVRSLAAYDDGTGGGPALYAGGEFETADGGAATGIARWDGASWSPVGNGTTGRVGALATFDDGFGGGTSLIAGGASICIDSGDADIAEFGRASLWSNLGFALPGVSGAPLLAGTGSLIAGQPTSINLSNARPAAPAALFLGLFNAPTAFKGGFVVPVPWTFLLTMMTSASGTIPLTFPWPAVVPPAFSMYYQYGIKDPAAVLGVSLSNALQSTTP